MKAQLSHYRQSPRKVRLVADLVRGKTVPQALAELRYTPKRASQAVTKLINSAVANAQNNNGLSAEKLVVKNVEVNEGRKMYRLLPMSRGRAFRIRKRSSHITLELMEKKEKKEKKASKK